ncbi:MAG: putative collagen-binding domain-containing protein, partial [Vicinamibacterales bacterium]
GVPDDPAFVSARLNMGWARNYAERLPLAAMTPQPELTSTGYALAWAGSEYLIYQPLTGPFLVRLQPGTYSVEWFEPATGRASMAGTLVATEHQPFDAPFEGDAVLYLKRVSGP